jgi:hypothetical protein
MGLLMMGGADGLPTEAFMLAMVDVGDMDLMPQEELKKAVSGKRGVSEEGVKLHCFLPILSRLIIIFLAFVGFCLWNQ